MNLKPAVERLRDAELRGRDRQCWEEAVREMLHAFNRAGADVVISYEALVMARFLGELQPQPQKVLATA
jgi:hypothetical protein